MKKGKILWLTMTIGVLTVGFFGFSFFEKTSYTSNLFNKEHVLKKIIFSTLSQAHYHNPEINDSFSEKAFDTYISRLDYNKHFLTSKDINQLKAFKNQIDDDIHGKKIALYSKSVEILSNRIQQVKGYYKEILSESFDFSKNETLDLNMEKRDFCKNEIQLKERWKKTLKYQALVQYYNQLNNQDGNSSKEETKTIEEINKEIREQLLKNLNNTFDLIDKLDNDDRFASYINSILSIYGPHTEYFPPEEKAAFDIRMSGQLEGIGAILIQRDGYIKINRLIPGGPAWKQGELKAEDVILKVAQEEDKDPVAISHMALKDAVKLIKGPKGTQVRLTVKKPDGRISIIAIVRDVVVIEETYAKSAIISDSETNKKYGYIYLPSFYTNFQKKNGRNCSEDIKQELLKMNKHEIAGIALDIRNNGGGSLDDVVKIAGLFIKEGPIIQVKNKIQDPLVLRDIDSKVYYEGPLVILINKISASASEILSAAMQDYKRAVIIGGTTTYGKGSVQRFIKLDRFFLYPKAYKDIKPLGDLKLTVQQFYRITGKAIQFKGVKADIKLPDIYQYIDLGERYVKHALPWGEIQTTSFKEWNDKKFDLQTFSTNSSKRIKNNKNFQLIEENALYLKQKNKVTIQSLNYNRFKKEQKEMREKTARFDISNSNISKSFEVTSLQDHYDDSKIEKIKQDQIKQWEKDIKKDIYIKEAILVLNDWTDINNTKENK